MTQISTHRRWVIWKVVIEVALWFYRIDELNCYGESEVWRESNRIITRIQFIFKHPVLKRGKYSDEALLYRQRESEVEELTATSRFRTHRVAFKRDWATGRTCWLRLVARFDLRCHHHESLLNIGGVLRWSLYKLNFEWLSKFLKHRWLIIKSSIENYLKWSSNTFSHTLPSLDQMRLHVL